MKFIGALFIGFCFLFVSLSVQAEEMTMQLVAPSKGWALSDGRIFWTEDNGEHWSDIAAELSGGRIANVFFLNDYQGWILLEADAGDDMVRVQLATTTDGGHNWSISSVPIPKQFPDELSGAVWSCLGRFRRC
jgi:photosystem II stability/assembly factor-like uncharacterized protein